MSDFSSIEEIIQELNLDLKVAYIDGDDLLPKISDLNKAGEKFTNIDKGENLNDSEYTPLTANAYLGAWGITEALDRGADIVVCPRVTDAAVVIGPAAWKFNWQRNDYDALAGALAAGHIIECGAQCCGLRQEALVPLPQLREHDGRAVRGAQAGARGRRQRLGGGEPREQRP